MPYGLLSELEAVGKLKETTRHDVAGRRRRLARPEEWATRAPSPHGEGSGDGGSRVNGGGPNLDSEFLRNSDKPLTVCLAV